MNDAPAGLAEALGDANGIGTVTVTGEGSLLQVSGTETLHVGYSGDGELNILDGGTVISQDSYIGTTFEGWGRVDVNDGTWTNNGNLSIGSEGYGVLLVENGGQVATGGSAYLRVCYRRSRNRRRDGRGLSVGDRRVRLCWRGWCRQRR